MEQVIAVGPGAAAVDGPDLISRFVRRVEALLEHVAAQRSDHEEVAILIAKIDRGQFGVVAQGLNEQRQHFQAFIERVGLGGRVQRQQAEQVAYGAVGIVQISLYVVLDALEECRTAGEDQPAGLLVIEQPEHGTGEQQQKREQDTDMNVQGETAFSGNGGIEHRTSLLAGAAGLNSIVKSGRICRNVIKAAENCPRLCSVCSVAGAGHGPEAPRSGSRPRRSAR